MSGDPLWINASAGAPAYTANELRQAMALGIMYGGRLLGARPGVRPGGDQLKTSLSVSTITVKAGLACVDPALTTAQGPYWVALPADETHTLTAADPTNPRKDITILRVYDHDEDASGLRLARSEYLVGTPNPSPVEPAVPAGAFRLSTIDVPASGGGSAVVTDRRTWTVAPGGILPVNGAGDITAAVEGRYRHRLDLGTIRGLEVDDGAAWIPAHGWPALFAYKPSGTSRTSTITFTADPSLSVAVEANTVYAGRMVLFCSSAASAAGDLAIRFAFPTGASLSFGVQGLVDTLASGSSADLLASAVEATSSPSSSVSIGCSSAFTVLQVDIALVVAATAGSLTLEWAQASSNANATTLRARSFMMLDRIG